MKSKCLRNIALLSILFPMAMAAEECQIFMGVAPMTQGSEVPEAVSQKLQTRLTHLMAQDGIVASGYDSQFFVAGRFDNGFFDRTSNGIYAVKTTLTLFIGDADGEKMFSSRQFELKGAGKTEQLAYSNALNSLQATSPQFKSFVSDGRRKIIEYFDANYNTYLTKARSAYKLGNYEEAFYYAGCIPECCRGYNEACTLINTIYTEQINDEGQRLLAQARAAWASSPDEYGAEQAHSFLVQINPQAACYKDAMALSDKIGKVVKTNWDFENVQKYKDSVALEKQRIQAARDIGVAWGQHQPQTINRYYWVDRYHY